jgi:hypothetical protein
VYTSEKAGERKREMMLRIRLTNEFLDLLRALLVYIVKQQLVAEANCYQIVCASEIFQPRTVIEDLGLSWLRIYRRYVIYQLGESNAAVKRLEIAWLCNLLRLCNQGVA